MNDAFEGFLYLLSHSGKSHTYDFELPPDPYLDYEYLDNPDEDEDLR